MAHLRLPGPEDEAPRVRLRVERHLRPVRDGPHVGACDFLHPADVVGVLVHLGRGDLVLDQDVEGDADDPDRGLHHPHHLVPRQVGRVPHVEVRGAQVRDDVRLRSAVDRADVHGDLFEEVLGPGVRLERREDPHHLQDRVVPEVGHRSVGAPPVGRDLEPEDPLLAPDDREVGGLADDDRRGLLDEARPLEGHRGPHRRLLVRREQYGERHVLALQLPGRREHRGASRLHVRGPPPVQERAVPLLGLPRPRLSHRDRVEVAVEQDPSLAVVPVHRQELRVHGGLEADRGQLRGRDVEDRAHVRAGPAPGRDELEEDRLRVILVDHAGYLRSISLCTTAIASLV